MATFSSQNKIMLCPAVCRKNHKQLNGTEAAAAKQHTALQPLINGQGLAGYAM
jgi:hypothetical protein